MKELEREGDKMIFTFVKKLFWFVIMVMAIPLDYLFFDMLFRTHQHITFKQCVKDNWEQLVLQ